MIYNSQFKINPATQAFPPSRLSRVRAAAQPPHSAWRRFAIFLTYKRLAKSEDFVTLSVARATKVVRPPATESAC